MTEPYADPFSGDGLFSANPDLYDYLHSLVFDPAGSVEMVDGAGQVINTLVRGRFSVEHVSSFEFTVHFTDVLEIDPYYKQKRFPSLELDAYIKATQGYVSHEEQDIIRRLEPFSVQVTREHGVFLLPQQVLRKIRAGEWPYLLFPDRYRFASDPLAQFVANRQQNLYYRTETPEADANVYYRWQDVKRLTASEIAERGIAPEGGAETAG